MKINLRKKRKRGLLKIGTVKTKQAHIMIANRNFQSEDVLRRKRPKVELFLNLSFFFIMAGHTSLLQVQ